MPEFINRLLTNLYFIYERLDWVNAVDLLLVTMVFFAILLLLRDTQAMVLLRGVLLLIVLISLLTSFARITEGMRSALSPVTYRVLLEHKGR